MLRIAVFFAIAAIGAALAMTGAMPGLIQDFASPSPRAAQPSAQAPSAQPVAQPPRGFGEVAIAADRGGQYSTDVVINGQDVKMMVDTGATMVALSSQTASRLGISPFPGDYKGRVQTANGIARVAPVTLKEMQVGGIALYNVEAWVLDSGAGNVDLLGMSFLKRLASVEQRSGTLVLRQ
jgi:aspartyl protease family protein